MDMKHLALLGFLLLAACNGGDLGLSTGGDQSGDLGGDGGGDGGTPPAVPLATSPYLALDLATGGITPLASAPDLDDATWRTSRMLFRRISPSGQEQFLLAVFEVTQAQWLALGGSDLWSSVPTSVVGSSAVADDRPAFALSHDDAAALAAGYQSARGVNLGLPTASQWAAAAGSGTWAWGEDSERTTVESFAAVRETTSPDRGAEPVGERDATGGLYDLHGNVWEWTSPGTELRGGSWYDSLAQARSANGISASEVGFTSATRHALFGVRLTLRP
jgi:Sulfatase-modifying factor enzyme 1